MGIDRFVYLGPLIVCKRNLKKVIKQYYGCNICKTIASNKIKFCCLCGKLLSDYNGEEEAYNVDVWKILEKIDDNFFHMQHGKEQDIWLLNKRGDIRNFNIPSENVYLNTSEINSEKELKYLQDNFKEEIKMFKDEYGDENIEITWGIYNYFY